MDDVRAIIRNTFEPGSTVYTDEDGAYYSLGSEGFKYAFVHTERYVDGAIHTKGIEISGRSWSQGTYVSVEPFHMFRYPDGQVFRFNERFGNDGDRFRTLVRQIVGKRLTFDQLTGKSVVLKKREEARF